MKINYNKVLAIVLPALLFSSGCVNRKAIVKDTFLLDAQRAESPAQASSEKTLAVLPFSIAPTFEGNGVVSRIDENRYESDFYNEYFVSPAQMITDQTRNWLSASGLFAQVLSPVSSVEPTHVLEGHIRKMVLDRRDSSNPHAEMEITFFLLEQHKRNRDVRFQRTYAAAHVIESQFSQDYIAAQSQCLRDILKKLEKDLVSK